MHCARARIVCNVGLHIVCIASVGGNVCESVTSTLEIAADRITKSLTYENVPTTDTRFCRDPQARLYARSPTAAIYIPAPFGVKGDLASSTCRLGSCAGLRAPYDSISRACVFV